MTKNLMIKSAKNAVRLNHLEMLKQYCGSTATNATHGSIEHVLT